MMRAGMWMLVALVWLAALPAAASDFELDRQTLKGLRRLAVVVEDLDPDLERQVSLSTLQTDIELKLRLAGITVLSQRETLRTLGSPYLYVRVNVLQSNSTPGLFAYSVSVALKQRAALVRDPEILVGAETWRIGGVKSERKRTALASGASPLNGRETRSWR